MVECVVETLRTGASLLSPVLGTCRAPERLTVDILGPCLSNCPTSLPPKMIIETRGDRLPGTSGFGGLWYP